MQRDWKWSLLLLDGPDTYMNVESMYAYVCTIAALSCSGDCAWASQYRNTCARYASRPSRVHHMRRIRSSLRSFCDEEDVLILSNDVDDEDGAGGVVLLAAVLAADVVLNLEKDECNLSWTTAVICLLMPANSV